jgi:hypothetical protein
MNYLKVAAINIGLAIAFLLAFDVTAYFLLPAKFAPPGYRTGTFAFRTSAGSVLYPRYYFETNAARGFDIKPAAEGFKVTNDFLFPIEAIELGCRDLKVSLDPTKSFIYVAGDSQTWGYVPIAMRWTERLEQISGALVLNCGVPATAQRHQRDKYKQVLRILRRRPDLVLVAYVSNDVWEDDWFPLYTVTDGFLIFNSTDPKILKARVEEEIERLNHPLPINRIRGFLKNYSLAAHGIQGLQQLASSHPGVAPPSDSIYSYSDSHALANKRAIESFARDVCSSGSRFAVVVLPDALHLEFPDYFGGLDDFLNARGIFSIDLHRIFSNRGLKYSDVGQINDPHFSAIGNAHVANALSDLMQKYGEIFGSCKKLAS